MRWKLFATLAEAAGSREVEVDAGTDATVGDAFEALLDSHPELEAEVLDADGDLQDHVRLLVDGADPFAEAEGFETTLDDGTELALFPPVSGG